ncbi:putative transmembrane protein [Ketogulonicigenium robustum]|uniref:Putative transmembrane protein n=1 Tax=Ketogulonicigenium robustum TaxID=92947 RepID=A0A1W6NZY8_9RHOB|nr:putative transmembrane protein [Ketogulonicigenium robustum]
MVALTLLNGALAMSELAVVSSRRAKLKSLSEAGKTGATTALQLAEDPGRFLSTVQIGITAVGVLSGAFSGATLGLRLTGWLASMGMAQNLADVLGVAVVVISITYLSLIVGELVPKQIALRDPEGVAVRVAPLMKILSRVAAPIVWFLDLSGRTVLRLLGQSGQQDQAVTEEEVRVILSEARDQGVIESEEGEMLSGVMRLADRNARGLMTPRREVEFLDLETPVEDIIPTIQAIGRPRIPVRARETDEVLGILYLTDAVGAIARGEALDLRAMIREVPVVYESADALNVIEILRKSANHMALVYDEYGSFEGLITTGDILEAITGTFQESVAEEPAFVTREDGSHLVAGWMPADEFCDRIGIPRDLAGDYETVAGLVLNHLHHLPQLGDTVEAGGWKFEVVDLDGRRIDKILVSEVPRE